MTLTPHQQDVLAFIRTFQKERRVSPCIREISEYLGNQSRSGAARTVMRIQEKGAVERDECGRILFPVEWFNSFTPV